MSSTSSWQQKNARFAQRLHASLDHVLIYEDAELQRQALACIPLERLRANAKQKLDAFDNSSKQQPQQQQVSIRYTLADFVLLELVAWFKEEFFTWVNQPACVRCASNAQMSPSTQGRALPIIAESVWLAHTVEVYECRACGGPSGPLTRFPRYNHPGKLLETRCGRCGEWANCFALLARSLGYDTRYVLDWSDHVWCEVYAESHKRWLHVDPCENAVDKPLIYERGWAKKLTYVIAFSRHECVDVTWRYSTLHDQVRARRSECHESWLARYTGELSMRRQQMLSRDERHAIGLRRCAEIVEFLTPAREARDGEDVGRQSGSLQWRLDRGEIQLPNLAAGYVIRIDRANVSEADGRCEISYSTAKDTFYVTKRGELIEMAKGWKNVAHGYANVQLKVEHDWKMCYLARTSGSQRAHIEWLFEVSDELSERLRRVDVKCVASCYENGRVRVSLSTGTSSESLDQASNRIELNSANSSSSSETNSELKSTYSASENVFRVEVLKRAACSTSSTKKKILKLRAELSDGKGDCAWQHTQLFRQSVNAAAATDCMLKLCFYFD